MQPTHFIVARLEQNSIAEAWGTFATPQAAAQWLGEYDGRLLDFIWAESPDQWDAVVEDGDIGLSHFQIHRLAEPGPPPPVAGLEG